MSSAEFVEINSLPKWQPPAEETMVLPNDEAVKASLRELVKRSRIGQPAVKESVDVTL